MTAKVYIYWNIRKRCYSAKKNGKVFAHFQNASIFSPEFQVSAAGRERVRRERAKNVHAYIVCEPQHCVILPDVAGRMDVSGEQARYNPYICETFIDNAGNALYNARTAELTTCDQILNYYTNKKLRLPVIYITKDAQ